MSKSAARPSVTLNKVKKKIKRARPKKWNRNPSGYGGSWVVLEFAELGEKNMLFLDGCFHRIHRK